MPQNRLCATSTLSALSGKRTLLLLGFALMPVDVFAAETVESLFGELEARQIQPSVGVLSWIQRRADQYSLVISFAPTDGTKLVADPGIRITPQPIAGVIWTDEIVEVRDTNLDYFKTPPRVELHFQQLDIVNISAQVEYAYCIVDQICLFGDELVTASIPQVN